jgi:hypothetical protein
MEGHDKSITTRLKLGNAFASGGQLLLQLGDAGLLLVDDGLGGAVLAGGHTRSALLRFLHPVYFRN